MLKSLFAITLAALAFSAQAQATQLPKEIRCQDERGFQLVIKDTGMEGFQRSLQVTIEKGGKTYSLETLRVVELNDQQMRLEGNADNGNVVRVGVMFESKTAYRGEAANGGLSPLPTMMYKDCQVKAQ